MYALFFKPRLLIYISSPLLKLHNSLPSRSKQHLVKLAPRRTYKAQEATRSLSKQERFPIRHPQVHRRHGRPRGLARQRERDERHHPRVAVYATEAQVSMASGYVELQRAGQRRVGLQRRRRRRVHGIDQHRDWKPEEAIVAVGERKSPHGDAAHGDWNVRGSVRAAHTQDRDRGFVPQGALPPPRQESEQRVGPGCFLRGLQAQQQDSGSVLRVPLLLGLL